jgi:hypothetical protein
MAIESSVYLQSHDMVMSFVIAVDQIDSFMKRGLNMHDGELPEEQPTMKREPKFVCKRTFGAQKKSKHSI